MAMRFWSSGIHGLSLTTFPAVNSSCKLQCHFQTVKASVSATTRASENGFPLVSEESIPVVNKKERLTRQERAAVVESFVQKYMEDHEGSFPNVSAVLKSTGGSRNVVKEILSDLEQRYVHVTSESHTNSASIVDAPREPDGESYSENFDVGEDEAGVSHNSGSRGEDEDEDEDEDEEEGTFYSSGHGDAENDGEEDDAGESEDFESSGERTSGKLEVERASELSNNGVTTESNQGDNETQSRLSSRLRGMGISNSLQHSSGHDLSQSQGSSRRFRPAGLAGSSLPMQDFSESESRRENGMVPEWQTLNFSNSAEKRLRNGAHSRGRIEDVSGTRSNERHGLFVRYLSCHATSADLREAFEDCGEIVRAYAIRARPNVKYTYGFVDFKTIESLQKALAKDKVYIRGNRVLTEPSTTAPNNSSSRKIADDSQISNLGSFESGTPQTSKKVFDTHLESSHGKAIRETGYKVAVMGIPMNVPLFEVQGALSKYGEIVLSDMKQESEGTYTANLEFEVMDARDKALAAKSVQLDGSHYSIFRVNPLKTSVVRLSNIGREANVDQVGATCELFGRVTEVISRCDGSVDVYFQSTEVENMPKILTRLNQVTMDGRRWQARPSSRLDSGSYESLLQTRGGQEWLQLESERMLSKIESALKKLVVDVEDLQELVKVNRCYTE